MNMMGHLTEAVYRRYAIVDTTMLREGGAKLQTFHDLHPSPSAAGLPRRSLVHTPMRGGEP
jgi:hypothetical protein